MTDEELAVERDETPETPENPEDPENNEGQAELSEEEKLMAKLKEAVEVSREEIGPLRQKLTITVPRDLMDERLGEQFMELKRDAAIPGFRKGRAPLRLVEKRFSHDVGDELAGQLVSSSYLAATEKEELNPLGDPMIWVTATEKRTDEKGGERTVEVEKLLPLEEALEFIELPKEGSLTYSCELDLKPEFELPGLEGIPLTRPNIKIEDEDVDRELDRMLRTRGTFEPVEGGKVEPDDMLYASMKMTVEDEVIRQEDNFDLAARDLRLVGVPLKGFGDAVVSKQVGDEVTFEAPVPEDHENIDIRGKTARFEFKLEEIKRLKVPPLDKEFLSAVGFESEKELREFVRSNMEAELEQLTSRALRGQVNEYLASKVEMEVPEALSQRQAERIVARRMMEMLRANVPEAEVKKAVDEMRTEAQVESVRELKLYFILEKVAEELSVEVSEDEINGAIAMIAQRQNRRFDRVRDELSKQGGLTSLYLQLRDEKILDQLVAQAQISEGPAPEKKKAPKKPTRKAPKKKAKKDD